MNSPISFPRVKRAANYSTQEKEEILRIVSKYPIIENKQTDGTNVKQKNAAWDAITREYNSLGFHQRNSKNLKHAYDNWKRKLKTAIADNKVTSYKDSQAGCSNGMSDIDAAIAARRHDKVEMNKTGGGNYTPLQQNHHALLLANLSSEQFEPLNNNFDLDGDYHQNNETLHQVPDYRDDGDYAFEDEVDDVQYVDRTSASQGNRKTFKSAISSMKTKKIQNLERKLEDDNRQKYYQFKLEAAKRKAELEEKLLNLNIQLAEINIRLANEKLENLN